MRRAGIVPGGRGGTGPGAISTTSLPRFVRETPSHFANSTSVMPCAGSTGVVLAGVAVVDLLVMRAATTSAARMSIGERYAARWR